MAELTKVTWNGEPIKVNIYFESDDVYTVSTVSNGLEADSFIKKISFAMSEGNNKVNPLGIATSNRISLQIYDKDDNLSPMNKSSIYYGKILNGIKIEVFISYDGEEYVPYGIYYATSWSGNFGEGWHGLVSISAEDKINTIGNLEINDIQDYSDLTALGAIKNVMKALDISEDDYYIDPAIDTNITYGIIQGGKARNFLNNVCQLLLARVIVDRNGIIKFVPALDVYNTFNEIELGSGDLGSLSNKNNTNINYNKVSIKYLDAGSVSDELLFNDGNHALTTGMNVINDIRLRFRALSIEQVWVVYSGDAVIEDIEYVGYQSGIQLRINVSGGNIDECVIKGRGIVVSTEDKSVTIPVFLENVLGGMTFEFDTKQMMDSARAYIIGAAIANYLNVVNKNVEVSGTAITPKLDLGDKVIIKDTDTMYDGTYKVTAMNIEFGENYSLSATLIRLA